MKVLIFTNENSLVSVYPANTQEEKDKATFHYLKDIEDYIQPSEDLKKMLDENVVEGIFFEMTCEYPGNIDLQDYDGYRVEEVINV